MSDSIKHIVVGVASLEVALELWRGRFGLEAAAAGEGADAGLERMWGLDPGQIHSQALVRTPGVETGWLHFVQFVDAARPVRAGAGATDLGPKSLDVNCRDMPARHAELAADGIAFRSAISEYEVDGLEVREVQMPAHDDTNVVLIEILGWEVALSARGYGAITSFVVVVPDAARESAFYQQVFGLDEVMHHRITGPAIEKAVGLPVGAALEMRLIGREADMFGRLELIEYEGLSGVDRFELARPPALGSLHCRYELDEIEPALQRAERAGAEVQRYGTTETLFGRVTIASITSPAGFRVEIYEAANQ